MSVSAFIGDLEISPMVARSVKGPTRNFQASDGASPTRSNDLDPHRAPQYGQNTKALLFHSGAHRHREEDAYER